MGYEYVFIYRPAKMVNDVDDLSYRFEKYVAAYLIQAGQMRHRDIVDRPVAYSVDYFLQSPRPQRVLPTTITLPQPLIISRSESLVASLRIFLSPSPIAYPTYYTSRLRYISISPTVPLITIDIPQHSYQTTSHYTIHLPQVWISPNATVSSVGHTIATWSRNVLGHHMFEGTEPCALLAKLFPLTPLSIYAVLRNFSCVYSVLQRTKIQHLLVQICQRRQRNHLVMDCI